MWCLCNNHFHTLDKLTVKGIFQFSLICRKQPNKVKMGSVQVLLSMHSYTIFTQKACLQFFPFLLTAYKVKKQTKKTTLNARALLKIHTLIYLQSKSTPFKLPHVMNLFTKKPLNASFMQNHTSEFFFIFIISRFCEKQYILFISLVPSR